MAYTAMAAEIYLGWYAPSGQLHAEKTQMAVRRITEELAKLDKLGEYGIDLTGEEWYKRGKTVVDRCESALKAPKAFLYARGKDVLKHFIDDMANRNIPGNPSAVDEAKRHLGMP